MEELANSVLKKLSDATASQHDWIALLDLTEEHHHPKARRLAIQKITPTIDGVGLQQVVMARKYRVRQWLRKGLQLLVDQDQFLSYGADNILGCKTVVKLCCLREQRLKDSIAYYSGICKSSGQKTSRYKNTDPRRSLETEFYAELSMMEDCTDAVI